ncbi:MAG: acyl-CoA dehydrogenase family protein [Myxococcales bacterium]|nr:acyl-CoA dehydrogenase family protein [Myxococcales bacterium]
MSSLDFALDDTQQALADAVYACCQANDVDGVARAETGSFPVGLWRALGELGVLGIAAPGAEGGAEELVAAFEALGRAGCPGPLVGAVCAVRLLPELGRDPVARGVCIPAVGQPPLFPWAPEADVFLEVSSGRAWRGEVRGDVQRVATLGGEPWGRVEWARGESLGSAEDALLWSDLARGAWLVGAAERLLGEAAEHARTREQFGRPIGEFQAVAHPLADSWISLTSARALVRAAAEPVERAWGQAGAEVGAARLSAERAAVRTSRAAHQTLGALGITLDGPLFHLSRRVRQLALAPPGTAGHAREAVLRSLTLTGEARA